jgi:hypothetical protein
MKAFVTEPNRYLFRSQDSLLGMQTASPSQVASTIASETVVQKSEVVGRCDRNVLTPTAANIENFSAVGCSCLRANRIDECP